MFPGLPLTTEFFGISANTDAPDVIIDPSPILILETTEQPTPKVLFDPIIVFPPILTPGARKQPSPIIV